MLVFESPDFISPMSGRVGNCPSHYGPHTDGPGTTGG